MKNENLFYFDVIFFRSSFRIINYNKNTKQMNRLYKKDSHEKTDVEYWDRIIEW